MEINKVKLDSEVETFIESEQEKYETSNGISCNYMPFCFVAKHGDEIIGMDQSVGVDIIKVLSVKSADCLQYEIFFH